MAVDLRNDGIPLSNAYFEKLGRVSTRERIKLIPQANILLDLQFLVFLRAHGGRRPYSLNKNANVLLAVLFNDIRHDSAHRAGPHANP